MAFPRKFQIRNPQRDNDNDAERLQRLTTTIDEVSSAVAAELSGLESRYKETAADVAFLYDAIENGDVAVGDETRVDDMVHTLMLYQKRTASLNRQLERLGNIRNLANGLFEDG